MIKLVALSESATNSCCISANILASKAVKQRIIIIKTVIAVVIIIRHISYNGNHSIVLGTVGSPEH